MMTRTALLSLLSAAFALSACDPAKAVGDGDVSDDGGGTQDGGAEHVDGGSEDGGSADGGGETGEQRIDDEPVDFVFWFDGDTTQSALDLRWLGALGQADLEVGEAHVSAKVDGASSVGVSVGPPYESDLFPMDGYEGVSLGFLLPLVGLDQDEDGAIDDDGELWGAGLVWPTYLYGTVPPDLQALGLSEGWNALAMDFEGDGIPAVIRVEDVPVEVSLRPVNFAEIGGTFERDDDWTGNPRLALIPQTMLEGAPISGLLYDQGLDETWKVTVSGRPPTTHLVTGDGGTGSVEFPIAFGDNDLSGSLSDGDTGGYLPCADGAPVLLTWYDPPTEPIIALYGTLWGMEVGWGIARVEPDPDSGETTVTYLDMADARDLPLSPDCPLE